MIVAEPERRLGADDVDLVVAARELFPQLRRHGAAAADRRITDDADVHAAVPSGSRCGATIVCLTTSPSA
jgi:hypothetical protein